MNIKELEQKRDDHITGFFWLALQIAIIFAVPAVVAALAGKALNTYFSTTGLQYALLLFALIFSWGIMAHQYQKKTRALKDIETRLKEARTVAAQQMQTPAKP
jgi:uncharacterized membrane protein YfcA